MIPFHPKARVSWQPIAAGIGESAVFLAPLTPPAPLTPLGKICKVCVGMGEVWATRNPFVIKYGGMAYRRGEDRY
jgi:hypothetical protein